VSLEWLKVLNILQVCIKHEKTIPIVTLLQVE